MPHFGGQSRSRTSGRVHEGRPLPPRDERRGDVLPARRRPLGACARFLLRARRRSRRPDIAAFGQNDGSVKLVHLRIAVVRPMGRRATGRVIALAFSAGGKVLATASDDGSVSVWDVPIASARETFRVTQAPLSACTSAPTAARSTRNRATGASSSGTCAEIAGSAPVSLRPLRPAGRAGCGQERVDGCRSQPRRLALRDLAGTRAGHALARPRPKPSSASCVARPPTSTRWRGATTAACSRRAATRDGRSYGASRGAGS